VADSACEVDVFGFTVAFFDCPVCEKDEAYDCCDDACLVEGKPCESVIV